MEVTIRLMREADLDAADRVMRLAFGTFLKLPDPLRFMGGAIIGSVFVGNWGSVGFFGPLTVHPDYWDGGVAQLLLRRVMECFEHWGVRHMGLYTFSTSLKHIGLYRSFRMCRRRNGRGC